MTDQALLERREVLFDALGDRTRRSILDLLAEGPRAVVDLAAELPVTRPAVSLHLKVLSDAGLVTQQAAGTRRIYRLDPEGLELLRTYLDRMWAGALDRFAAAAEQAHRTNATTKKSPGKKPTAKNSTRSRPKEQ